MMIEKEPRICHNVNSASTTKRDNNPTQTEAARDFIMTRDSKAGWKIILNRDGKCVMVRDLGGWRMVVDQLS